MNFSIRPSFVLSLPLVCGGLLAANPVYAETTTTTTTTTVTHPDGSTTKTVQEATSDAPASATEQTAPAASTAPNIIGPTGVTGVMRRSDRRQDRREGDPRIDR